MLYKNEYTEQGWRNKELQLQWNIDDAEYNYATIVEKLSLHRKIAVIPIGNIALQYSFYITDLVEMWLAVGGVGIGVIGVMISFLTVGNLKNLKSNYYRTMTAAKREYLQYTLASSDNVPFIQLDTPKNNKGLKVIPAEPGTGQRGLTNE